MEVMEEGDLMDRVPILVERDRQYYEVSEIRASQIPQNTFWVGSQYRVNVLCCPAIKNILCIYFAVLTH